MTLHLVRIGVNMHALARYAVIRRVGDDDGGYALHCALIARFGDAAPRPFRFLPDHGTGPQLLGYTTDAAALGDAAALPAVDDLPGALFGAPQLQPMPSAWRVGARYGFEVRVRPVVRFGKQVREARAARADAWQRGAGEIDAYVAACERDPTGSVDREAVYLAWLAKRLGAVATLDHATLRLFRRSRTLRSTHRPGAPSGRTHRVEGPDAVIGGTLTVADPDGFAATLAGGLGRHAAFGYGMLLLSPPGRGG